MTLQGVGPNIAVGFVVTGVGQVLLLVGVAATGARLALRASQTD